MLLFVDGRQRLDIVVIVIPEDDAVSAVLFHFQSASPHAAERESRDASQFAENRLRINFPSLNHPKGRCLAAPIVRFLWRIRLSAFLFRDHGLVALML